MMRAKKKKKNHVILESDADPDTAVPATPPPRSIRPRRDSATKSALSVTLFETMTKEMQDVVIVSMWEDTHAAAGRKYLRDEEKTDLVLRVAERCSLSELTFDALRKRVSRIQDRGSFKREPGSGRSRKFTEEHANAARETSFRSRTTI
jgi:hypothetical protein